MGEGLDGDWLYFFIFFFMKMKFVRDVVVTFLLLRYSGLLVVNLYSAPLANTNARCQTL